MVSQWKEKDVAGEKCRRKRKVLRWEENIERMDAYQWKGNVVAGTRAEHAIQDKLGKSGNPSRKIARTLNLGHLGWPFW
jgi:hypothetical protein